MARTKIVVNTHRYAATHGHIPRATSRGLSWWAFQIDDRPEPMRVAERTYTAALAIAKRYATHTVTVLP